MPQVKEKPHFSAEDDTPYFSAEDVAPEETVTHEKHEFKKISLHPGKLATALILMATFFLGLPVLWIYFSAGPEDLKSLTVLTIPYLDLMHLFLLCAVVLIVSSLILIPVKPIFLAAFFLLSLFCSFPLIIGLRYSLGLSETVVAMDFFKSWPFFLYPTWALSQFLLPVGLLLFVFLYFRALFTKRNNLYAYLFSIALISGAVFLSISEMNRAGQPNLLSLFQKNAVWNSYRLPMSENQGAEQTAAVSSEFLKTQAPLRPIETVAPYTDPISQDQSKTDQPDAPSPLALENLENELKTLFDLIDKKISQMENQSRKENAEQINSVAAIKEQMKILSSRMESIFHGAGAMKTKNDKPVKKKFVIAK